MGVEGFCGMYNMEQDGFAVCVLSNTIKCTEVTQICQSEVTDDSKFSCCWWQLLIYVQQVDKDI